jgi:hydrogenase expression/formation protein HypC
MCLAIPSQITEIDPSGMGTIDVDGVTRQASLLLLEDPRIGDWVIVHAGFAIQKISPETARQSLDILKETLAFVENRNADDSKG